MNVKTGAMLRAEMALKNRPASEAPALPETAAREGSAHAPLQSLADALCPDLDQQLAEVEREAGRAIETPDSIGEEGL